MPAARTVPGGNNVVVTLESIAPSLIDWLVFVFDLLLKSFSF